MKRNIEFSRRKSEKKCFRCVFALPHAGAHANLLATIRTLAWRKFRYEQSRRKPTASGAEIAGSRWKCYFACTCAPPGGINRSLHNSSHACHTMYSSSNPFPQSPANRKTWLIEARALGRAFFWSRRRGAYLSNYPKPGTRGRSSKWFSARKFTVSSRLGYSRSYVRHNAISLPVRRTVRSKSAACARWSSPRARFRAQMELSYDLGYAWDDPLLCSSNALLFPFLSGVFLHIFAVYFISLISELIIARY